MIKIIIIEDDPKLAAELAKLLAENAYATQIVRDFHDIPSQILKSRADLALLDINIPNTTGERVLRQIREQEHSTQTTKIPIIMLTSRNSEADEIISLSYGADDFITKPYSPQILLLRIEAVLNRTQPNPQAELSFGNIILNPLRSSLTHRNPQATQPPETTLTKNEFAILHFLLRNRSRIVSRADIMDQLWDSDNFIDDNTLTANISRLRQTLATAGLPDLIRTRRSQGYIIT